MKKNKTITLIFSVSVFLFFLITPLFSAEDGKPKKLPYVFESPEGRKLILPEDLDEALLKEFPTYRMLDEKDFDPEMLKYYYSRLIGVHPGIAWGDFNGDKKQDYLLLIVTGETKWGPLVDLVVFNGNGKKGDYTSFRLGEVYNIKDDYLSFDEGKLYKGKFKKNGWYINWDKKEKTYNVLKS